VYFPSADIADAELRTLVVLNALHCPYFPVLRDTFTDEANNRLFVFPVYRSMVASDTKDFDSLVRHSMSLIDALQLMHKNGIAHLDIHPANILIDPVSDCVVLIDFGFSLPLKYAGGVYPRRGFRGFMAPELVGGMSIDGSCLDAFAAGMVMLFWLSQSDPVLLATLSCATNGTSIFADNLPNQSVQSLSAAVCTLIDDRQTTQPRHAGLLKIVNGLLLYRITPGQALMSLREFLG
jgi:serine/threonine protein kinase